MRNVAKIFSSPLGAFSTLLHFKSEMNSKFLEHFDFSRKNDLLSLLGLGQTKLDPQMLQNVMIEQFIRNKCEEMIKASQKKNSLNMTTPDVNCDEIVVKQEVCGDSDMCESFSLEHLSAEEDTVLPIDYSISKINSSLLKEQKEKVIVNIQQNIPIIKLEPKDDNQQTAAAPIFESDLKNNFKKPTKPVSKNIKNNSWVGQSIFYNLSSSEMTELDHELLKSHKFKLEVIKQTYKLNPLIIKFNPKKSRLRIEIKNPLHDLERSRNNYASRRSRYRKKYELELLRYSRDFDEEENRLLQKKEEFLTTFISDLEKTTKQ
ncbi:CLUMA_CG003455, isoform A [Clunio marinus]|uniref:CLUMA_CG003455, isoform A n=1 Tax=Clunio marinus TaxID=568069 RepID=A0A1J1HTD9_9DIPT|nr:CLUMA_CG003455, isoform A [Clunio marinus]